MHEKNTSTTSGGKPTQRCCKMRARWDVICASLYNTRQTEPKPTRTWGPGGTVVETVSKRDFPRNVTKLFTGLLQPTFKEGTGSFVFGGPYGPEGEPPPSPPPQNGTKLFILDFNCQPLRRVLFCFMSAGPYGPRGVLFNFEGGEGEGPQSVF